MRTRYYNPSTVKYKIVRLFEEVKAPLTTQEVHELLGESSKTTVYNALCELRRIEAIKIVGMKPGHGKMMAAAYELAK